MIWNIERFNSKGASGWLVTNDPVETPRLLLYFHPGNWTPLECNVSRPDVKAVGAHATGLCGFRLDARMMARAAKTPVTAIFEERTRLLLYRFVPDRSFIKGQVLFLTFPASYPNPLVEDLKTRFQLGYSQAERIDRNTRTYMFDIRFTDSILIAGTLKGDEALQVADQDRFRLVTQFSPPAEALAQRLDRMCEIAVHPEHGATFLTGSLYGPLTASLMKADLSQPEALAHWYENLSEQDRLLLSDPVVRQLSSAAPHYMIDEAHLVQALRLLSRFSAIGTTEQPEQFIDLLRDSFGIDDTDLPDGAGHPALSTRAAILAGSDALKKLTIFDQKLYDLVGLTLGKGDPKMEDARAILARRA
ncbi:hypothetical protein [Microvirga sp. TS319]|uniref:hypothetical protein n=1 Tax=Microvirga sp. TS319 TaxID=3241165 RepID=UPI003519DCD9